MPESFGRPPRAVLDTNVVLSALVFSKGRVARLRAAWQGGDFVPLVNRQTVNELLRALSYPKFRFGAGERDLLLAEYLPYTEVVAAPRNSPGVADCRDPADREFLALAAVGRADALVTGDQDLLVLRGQSAFPILTADAFIRSIIAPR